MTIIARLALIFVFAGINVGLTVLAMGSVAPFLSDSALIALAVAVLVLPSPRSIEQPTRGRTCASRRWSR